MAVILGVVWHALSLDVIGADGILAFRAQTPAALCGTVRPGASLTVLLSTHCFNDREIQRMKQCLHTLVLFSMLSRR